MIDEQLASGDDFAEFDDYAAATPDAAASQDQPADPDDVTGHLLPPNTGNARVDAAAAALDELDELPTAGHADVFEDVHRQLQGALADLDGG